MNFVFPDFANFSNLTNEQNIVLSSEKHSLSVNSLVVTNMTKIDIRITLCLSKKSSDGSVSKSILVNNHLLHPFTSDATTNKSTVNLITEYDLGVFLPVTELEGITHTADLICYSGGINQLFDCSVTYITYIETPIT